MKLRNKKTGEIREDSDLGKMLIRYAMPSYDSIAELCEEWEDYTPAEPLIKDEKIRKAVRAWAEVNGIDKVKYVAYGSNGYTLIYEKINVNLWIQFERSIVEFGKLVDYQFYTIAELCGEEE